MREVNHVVASNATIFDYSRNEYADTIMPSPLINGLRLLELLTAGPSTLARAAATLGVNRSTVLRSARILESDGWLVHLDGHWELGPRALVLGDSTPARARAVRAAEVAHAVSGATGLTTVVGQLAGRGFYFLARTEGTMRLALTAAVHTPPLGAYAGAQCLLIDLEAGELDDYLGPEPYPQQGPRTITSKAAMLRRLEEIRSGNAAIELEESGPGNGCVALPWRFDAEAPLMSISCLGPVGAVAHERDTIERVLRAAIAPGAALRALSPLTSIDTAR